MVLPRPVGAMGRPLIRREGIVHGVEREGAMGGLDGRFTFYGRILR